MAGKTTEKELEASRAAAMEALDKLLEAKNHFRSAAEAAGLDLKDEAIDQLTEGRNKAEELSIQATEYVYEKPLSSLAIAFVGGFVISQLLTRK